MKNIIKNTNYFFLKTKSFKLKASEGFSLVELLVTISIFVIVTGIVLVNFPSFSSKIALDNLAHEIALAIRETQVFGVASKETTAGSRIFPTRGAHFDKSQNTTFVLFIDADDNNRYGGAPELIETFNIQRRNYISEICGYAMPGSSCTPLDSLDITFTRPNPEPSVMGMVGTSEALYSYATIAITSPKGISRKIVVWSNGQIAIQ